LKKDGKTEKKEREKKSNADSGKVVNLMQGEICCSTAMNRWLTIYHLCKGDTNRSVSCDPLSAL